MKKATEYVFLVLFSGLSLTHLSASEPHWITHLPFAEDAFYGVGRGSNLQEAVMDGKIDILMQLNSQVQAVITMEENSRGGEFAATEKLETFIKSNSLRAAEIEDQYHAGNTIWVLMKYGNECGSMLVDSALKRFEDEFSYESELLLNRFQSVEAKNAVRLERRLEELEIEDYRSEDISISLVNKKMIIRILNFLPYETTLKPSQERGLTLLSSSLFKELEELNYRGVSIVGHANPTGQVNEKEDLEMLSKNRAETLSRFLRRAGIIVLDTTWEGGREPIGNVETPEGRGKNRRVDLIIDFDKRDE